MMRVTLLVAAAALLSASCRRGEEQEARNAVTSYLDRLTAAYRASEETIVDPLVTEAMGRKLTGLIGVKSDRGVVLDSRLLELRFEATRRDGNELVVDTRERWRWREVAIKTGAQVGEESLDLYVNRYRLVHEDGKLKVSAIEFREPPIVGRKAEPVTIEARRAHGVPDAEPVTSRAPATERRRAGARGRP